MDKYALKQFIWCVCRDLPCWNNWVGTTWSDDPKEEKAENAFDWSLYGPNSHLSELRSRREHRSLPHSPPYLPLLSSLLLSSPLLSSPTIPSSGLIQSILWGDCSREKDVAEANERIITTGSKRSCKSVPSGHAWNKESKTRQTGRCREREEGDKRERKDRVMNSVSHGDGHRTCCCVIDAPLVRSSSSVSLTLPYVDQTSRRSPAVSGLTLSLSLVTHRFTGSSGLKERAQTKPVRHNKRKFLHRILSV